MLTSLGRASGNSAVREARQLCAQLTEREQDVASLVAEGLGNREIGERLFLSESTVKTHLSGIQQKFGVDNRVLVAVTCTLARLA